MTPNATAAQRHLALDEHRGTTTPVLGALEHQLYDAYSTASKTSRLALACRRPARNDRDMVTVAMLGSSAPRWRMASGLARLVAP
jgi:hypothetical protein